jgi:transcriptional regulator with XRE-family HTH domain
MDDPMLSRQTWDVLHNLPAVVYGLRRAQGLSLRAVAEQCNLSYNVLSRFERGGETLFSTTLTLLAWVDGQPPAIVLGADREAGDA